jgi:FlaA1/EpsC-like NDP-sugar epimerase
VTGAGGSIGSELCRQIVALKPKVLVLFEQSEYGLYQIDQELQRLNQHIKIISVLGTIQNKEYIARILEQYQIDTVFHAAAYKHVPLVEANIIEGIKNNVFGTLSVAQAAIVAKVSTFVLISTDKAVRPTNIMGATKRLAELILQAFAQEKNDTCFCMVRFGNVLGSSGSVVPLFKTQIRAGGPVTVTHPDIIRYFMTIPEAAQLVIQASAMAKGGDVFLLDMGEPVRIADLAKRMIHLMGYHIKSEEYPEGIDIKYSGLRAGEKLYEELLVGDNDESTEHPRVRRALEYSIGKHELDDLLMELNKLSMQENINGIYEFFSHLGIGFVSTSFKKTTAQLKV